MKPVVIFDIEASCEDKSVNPRYNMETIEIGAVKLLNNRIIDEFQIFIEPEYIQKLTPFCEQLTGITFKDLEGQPKFIEAIIDFYHFIKGCNIYSCGDFDRKFLIREIEEKGDPFEHTIIINAINSTHTDLKKIYTKFTNNQKAGMVGMAKELNIKLQGRQHRGIDDAKNLANIYVEIQNIRTKHLSNVFNEDLINKVIKTINEQHSEIYEIKRHNNTYMSFDKLNSVSQEHTLTSLLDLWREVIIVDIEHRGLGYLTTNELKILKNYTI